MLLTLGHPVIMICERYIINHHTPAMKHQPTNSRPGLGFSISPSTRILLTRYKSVTGPFTRGEAAVWKTK